MFAIYFNHRTMNTKELKSAPQFNVMLLRSFHISFDYYLDRGKIAVNLCADVEMHTGPSYYLVRNIRSKRDGSAPAIPNVQLTRINSTWVYYDSRNPTDLTVCIGHAIDAHERR